MLLLIWGDIVDRKTLKELKYLFNVNMNNQSLFLNMSNLHLPNEPSSHISNEYYYLINLVLKKMNLNEKELNILKNIVENNFNDNMNFIKNYANYLLSFKDKKRFIKISLSGLVYDHAQKLSIITGENIKAIDIIKTNKQLKDVIKYLSKIKYDKNSKLLFEYLDKTSINTAEENIIKDYLITKIEGYATYKAMQLQLNLFK